MYSRDGPMRDAILSTSYTHYQASYTFNLQSNEWVRTGLSQQLNQTEVARETPRLPTL